jgi:hypothetical protein
MSTYNKRTLEPRIIDELTRVKEIKKKRFCSRHDIMEEINFPSANPSRIVIKSNEKGTGFMRNHYHEEFCRDYINKKDFDAVVDKVSLIIGNEYSRKRKLDTKGMSIWIQLAMLLALVLMMVFCCMAYYLPDYGIAYQIFTYCIVAAGFTVALIIMFYNFCLPFQESLTFEQMVFRKVNEHLIGINPQYKSRNLEWILIPCHYWMELRMLDKREEDYNETPKYGPSGTGVINRSSSNEKSVSKQDDEDSNMFDDDEEE